jgi:signal transduction histidine kinase
VRDDTGGGTRRGISLRRRFVLVLASFGLAVAAGFGLLSWWISKDALSTELDRRLTDVAGAAAVAGFQGSVALAFEPGSENVANWSSYRYRLLALVERGYVDAAFIFDGSPSSTAYRSLVTAQPADSIPIGTPLREMEAFRPEVNLAIAEGAATTAAFEGEDGRLYEYGFVRLDDSPAILGVLIPADFLEPLNLLRWTLLVGSLGALALAVALGGLLAANIVQPLEHLSHVALRIQRGHLKHPVDVGRGDELGRLSRAMERMRRGILERDEQLRLMLAQVAHEIRNPLGGLELFASAAADTDDPDERLRLMEKVRGEVTELNRIIDDFLTFARPLQTDREGCRLDVTLPAEPLMAVADGGQVKRAVLNLLHNAAQVANHVRLSAERQGSEIVVYVLDDGPGIPEDMRERIFEPFITDKEKGAGLGLAIVRKVVEAHGGRVEVASASDGSFENGAEFRLYFIGLEEPPGRPHVDSSGSSPATARGTGFASARPER